MTLPSQPALDGPDDFRTFQRRFLHALLVAGVLFSAVFVVMDWLGWNPIGAAQRHVTEIACVLVLVLLLVSRRYAFLYTPIAALASVSEFVLYASALFFVPADELRFVNPALCALVGYAKEEVLQRPFLDFIHESDRDLVADHYRRRLCGEPVPPRYELRILTRHRGSQWFDFKPLNDEQGHAVGDLLLIEVARRLHSSVREVDTVARLGGDEFVVVLSGLDADAAVARGQALVIAEQIRAALARPYVLAMAEEGEADATIEHRCSSSIGVTLFLGQDRSPNEIVKRADGAMYQAKEAGRNAIRLFEADS